VSKGYFVVSQDVANPRDIQFQQIPLAAGEAIPEDQLDLRDKIDSTLTTIRLLFGEKDKRFGHYFRPLLSLAQLGLVGASANPALAVRALSSLQNEILSREGGLIKNGYMKKLGGWAIGLALPALILSVIGRVLDSPSAVVGFPLLWVGCMAGVWLSFGARKVTLTFQELGMLEQDRLSPAIRLVFAGILTMAIGLLLATGTVLVQIGRLSSTDFESNAKVALLIGLLCGISELALSAKVSQHAKEVLGIR
jgi:hypothetical protein